MRTLFSIVALALALAVVGLLARPQLSGAHLSASGLPLAPSVAPGGASMGHAAPPAQQVQQYQKTVEALIQQSRALPEDTQ